MQSIFQSNPLLIVALFVLVAVGLMATPRRRRGPPSRGPVGREAASRRAPSKPTSGGRRTNLVTDEEWQAFREVKAGITGQKGVQHGANRHPVTLESGTASRCKAAADHGANRHWVTV
jgi:hypothetical protein